MLHGNVDARARNRIQAGVAASASTLNALNALCGKAPDSAKAQGFLETDYSALL
jgi:hypothetical protein